MGMIYKINVLQALKDKQKLREGKPVSWENIETFCRLLEIQPGDLLEYKPDTAENE